MLRTAKGLISTILLALVLISTINVPHVFASERGYSLSLSVDDAKELVNKYFKTRDRHIHAAESIAYSSSGVVFVLRGNYPDQSYPDLWVGRISVNPSTAKAVIYWEPYWEPEILYWDRGDSENVDLSAFIDTSLDSGIVIEIGTNKAWVEGNAVTLSSATFLDKRTNRTMLPVRAVAELFDIDSSDIVWSDTQRTITIYASADRTIVFKVNSDIMKLNNVSVQMVDDNGISVKTIISNGIDGGVSGRAYLPFLQLARAFNKPCQWYPMIDGSPDRIILNPSASQIAIAAQNINERQKPPTELSGYMGMNFYIVADAIGNMQDDYATNSISYSNDHVTISADTDELEVTFISIDGGNYTLCGIYVGMDTDAARRLLLSNGWTMTKNEGTDINMEKGNNWISLDHDFKSSGIVESVSLFSD